MLSQIICFRLVLFVISIKCVLSGEHSIICRDATEQIDAITYAEDIKMYFVAIGSHFWWAKESDFPLKDKAKLDLPKDFTKATAAVYIDTRNGCPHSRAVRPQEKEIYITGMIGDDQMFMTRDTATGKWDKPFKREADNCLKNSVLDYNKPIDAMFALNYLEIFFVQGEHYSMVDCKYICTDPTKYGTGKTKQPIKDFLIKDPIHAIYSMKSTQLFLFSNKVYYELKITGNNDGKVTTVRPDGRSTALDIQKDFMRLNKDIDCNETETPEGGPSDKPEQPNQTHNPDNPEPNPSQPEDTGSTKESESDGDSSAPTWLIILVIVIAVVIIILICSSVYVVFGLKNTDSKAEGGKASAPKTGAPVSQKNASAVKTTKK